MSSLLTRPDTVPATRDDGEGPLFEIVDGERVEKTMSGLAQQTGSRISRKLGNHAEDEIGDGFVGTEHFIACFEWMPKTKRRPDVAYWRGHQYPRGLPPKGDLALPPAMAIEIVSPGDGGEEMEIKLAEYFRAGVELVWVVYPLARKIRAEQPDGTTHTYHENDTITAAPVLPGFSITVADLFPPTWAA